MSDGWKAWLDPGGRSIERLRAHYEIERDLATRLRNAPAAERGALYGEVYDELFRSVPDHPQLTQPRRPELIRARVAEGTRLVRAFLPPGGTFLEIGAGDCALSLALCDYAGTVRAIEVSEAIAETGNAPPNFSLVITDGTSIPIEPCSIDVAYSNQVMEHLHPEDALAQAANIAAALKPGGKYLCLTPHRLLGPSDVSAFFTDGDAEGFHLREYSTRELRTTLRAAGFSRVQVLDSSRGRVVALAPGRFIVLEAMFALLPVRARKRLKDFHAVWRALAPGGGVLATVRSASQC